MADKIICLDLETDSLDVNKANIRVFGILELDTNKYTITVSKFDALQIIKKADFVITYNGKEYDAPILERCTGYKIPKDQHIDILHIFKKRQAVISKKPFSNFKLKTIVKELSIDEEGKGEIDYSIFQKKTWTEQEREEIVKYLKQDLNLTAKCWEWLKHKFEPFKEFMSYSDVQNYKHINTSMGAYTYKVICHLCKLPEEYDFDTEKVDYEGAYVRKPIKEFVRGNVLCFDFASLYPMMYVHANLFSHHCKCCNDQTRWDGGIHFNIKGRYCKREQGQIEHLIKKFFLLRKEYKKNKDDREQVVKIIINSLYGVSGSPIFKSLYNLNTAQDCTALGQQCIKYAIGKFETNGYICLYTDTDSVYVEIPEGKTEHDCIELSKQISKDLSNFFPFPWEEFNLKLECKIKYIAFFKDGSGEYKKKHYLYVTEDDKLTVKGLPIVKKDCSKLSKHIFTKYIKGFIKEKHKHKFSKSEIDKFIKDELELDKSLLHKQFSIKPKDHYKNNTSIQALIFDKYGEGEHHLIRNKKIGVGKGVKYCSPKEAAHLHFTDFDLSGVYKELDAFITREENLKLERFI